MSQWLGVHLEGISWCCKTPWTFWLSELLLIFTTTAILFTSTRRYFLMTRSSSEIACGVTTVGLVQPSGSCDKTYFQTSCSIHTQCAEISTHCSVAPPCSDVFSMGFCSLLSGRIFCLLPPSFQYSSHFSHPDYTTITPCTHSKHSTCFNLHSWFVVPTAYTFGVSIFLGPLTFSFHCNYKSKSFSTQCTT